jgi:DNA polymerase-3 subunit delta'
MRDAHPDVQRITAEGRSIKTDTIRTMQHGLTLQPLEARYKIVLIEDFQKATDNAADALLKTLEEPPSKAKLILTADTRHNVRQTIVSRSQIIALRPVPAALIEDALSHTTELPAEQAAMVAHLAAGRPGWALRAAADSTLLADRGEIIDELLTVLYGDRVDRFAYAEAIYRRENLIDILEMWQAWWRDILLVAEGSSTYPVNADRVEDVHAVAGLLTREEARDALRAIRKTLDIVTNTNANKRLALEVMLLNIPYLSM